MILFDFENSCRGHYINDIAVVIYYARMNKLSGDDEGFARFFLEAFRRGYEAENHLPEEEIQSIPWLLLNRGLIVYAYLLKIWPGDLNEEQLAVASQVEQMIVRDRTLLGI